MHVVCVCIGGTLREVLLLGIRRLFFMFILFIFPLNAKILIADTKTARGSSRSGCCGTLHRSACRTKVLTHPPTADHVGSQGSELGVTPGIALG